MKITICDLLKLIKDGKAPQKIKFRGEIYIWNNIDYLTTNKLKYLFSYYDIITIFNEKVEVIEEDKKIEKIKMDGEYIIEYAEDGTHRITTNRKDRNIYVKKINQLIEEIEKLKGKSE